MVHDSSFYLNDQDRLPFILERISEHFCRWCQMTFLERYLTAIDKCYVQSLNDPETEPYKSKYEAKKLFEQLRQEDIEDVSDSLQKEFHTLDLLGEGDDRKFITVKPDEEVKETSSKCDDSH